MTPDRWRQVNEAFLAVAAAPTEDRSARLAQLGSVDEDLRREVERLLDGDALAASDGFLDGSPLQRVRGADGSFATDATITSTDQQRERVQKTDSPIRIPDFDLVRKLDRGGFGDVWLARSRSGVFRAIKILPHSMLGRVEVQGLRTYETFAGRHPNLIDVRHVGETAEWLYYVMELADGYSAAPTFSPADYVPRTLKTDLRRRGALPPNEAIAVMQQLLSGLRHLHEAGLLHRDIKPANIVFVAGVAKLADIGLLSPDDAQRRAGMTPDYAPPGGIIDRSGDLFSAGRVLAEMLCGALPPIGDTTLPAMTTERCAIVAPFVPILNRACAAEPGTRFQSSDDFLRGLADIAAIDGESTDAADGRHAASRRRHVRRIARWRNAGVGGILLLIAGLMIFYRTPPTRGEVQMTVVPHGRSTDAEIEVEKEFPLKAGDQVRFRIKLDRPGYPLLAVITPDGEPDVVYPMEGDVQQRVSSVDVPSDGARWELSDASGCILVVLLLSDRPIVDLAVIRDQLHNLPAPDITAECMVRADDDRPVTIKTLKQDRVRGAFDPKYTRRTQQGAIEQIRGRFKDRFPFVCVLAVPQIRP